MDCQYSFPKNKIAIKKQISATTISAVMMPAISSTSKSKKGMIKTVIQHKVESAIKKKPRGLLKRLKFDLIEDICIHYEKNVNVF